MATILTKEERAGLIKSLNQRKDLLTALLSNLKVISLSKKQLDMSTLSDGNLRHLIGEHIEQLWSVETSLEYHINEEKENE